MDNNDTNNNASVSSAYDQHDKSITPPSRRVRKFLVSVMVLVSITSLLSSYGFVDPFYYYNDMTENLDKSIITHEQTVDNATTPFEDKRPQSSLQKQNVGKKREVVTPSPTSSSSSSSSSHPPIKLSIPHKVPLTTVTPATIPPHALGGATLPMFLGTWHPSPTPSSPSIICPVRASQPNNKYQCNYTTSKRQRTVKTYHSPTPLPPFDALRFESLVRERGPLLFVGDSIGGQLANGLSCLLEETLGWERLQNNDNIMFFCRSSQLVEPPSGVLNDVEMIPPLEDGGMVDLNSFFDMSWVDEAIDKNASFVIYNTGAWWNNKLYFRRRGDWCDWSSWPPLSRKTMVDIFEKSLRYTLIPELKRLWRDYGIRTVWVDIPVGGEWDDSIRDITASGIGGRYIDYYHMFPVFNRIGRRLVVEEAEGWLLPTFDLSLKRWDDHMFQDAKYTAYDPLHWCETYDRNYVPAVWAHLLEQVLFGDGEDDNDNVKKELLDNSDSSIETSPDEDSRLLLTIDETHDDQMMIMPPFPNDELMMNPSLRTKKQRRLKRFHHVPYSRSNETTCPCSDGTSLYHCVANIGCEWVISSTKGTFLCQERRRGI